MTVITRLGVLGACAVAVVDGSDILAPACFSAIIAGCYMGDRTAKLLFANPLSFFLGEISFSIYLIHAPLLAVAEFVQRLEPVAWAPFLLPIYVVLLLSLSNLLFRFVEMPLHGLGRIWQNRIFPRG